MFNLTYKITMFINIFKFKHEKILTAVSTLQHSYDKLQEVLRIVIPYKHNKCINYWSYTAVLYHRVLFQNKVTYSYLVPMFYPFTQNYIKFHP
jgi:hypothetical protein